MGIFCETMGAERLEPRETSFADVEREMPFFAERPTLPFGLTARAESRFSRSSEVFRPIAGLPETRQETHVLEDGSTLFDSPVETGALLNSRQGRGIEGFEGTCGIVSAENVARLAGKDITEADAVGVACDRGLCLKGRDCPGDNGAIDPEGIAALLDALGIEPSLVLPSTIDALARLVEGGHGVIAVVEVGRFWEEAAEESKHAVTVTSVERDQDGGLSAFYVCDSGTGGDDSARRVSAGLMGESLSGDPIIATAQVIR